MKTTKFLAFLCVLMWLTTSCDQNEPSSGGNNEEGGDSGMLTSIQQKLIGTTWDMIEAVSNGTQYQYHARLFFKNKNTVVFSNVYSESDPYKDIYSGECTWKMNGENDIYINPWPTVNNTNFADAFVDGVCNAIFAGPYTILYITDTEMKMYDYISEYNYTSTRTYKRISGNSGGNGFSQGVTDLYLYDYTEWPTKIKVVYKYESDLPVTSAKIYYGEYSASSSVNATVSSSTITATISGLKKNTVYYVKASATTSKGTVTSSESRVMTAIE